MMFLLLNSHVVLTRLQLSSVSGGMPIRPADVCVCVCVCFLFDAVVSVAEGVRKHTENRLYDGQMSLGALKQSVILFATERIFNDLSAPAK